MNPHPDQNKYQKNRQKITVDRRKKVDDYFFTRKITAKEIAILTKTSVCTINKDISVLFKEKQIGCIIEKAK